MSYLINTEIAGINFLVSCRDPIILQDSDPAYTSFLKSDKESAIDVNINLELNNIPDTKNLKKIFDSGQSWSMFQNSDDYFVTLNPPTFDQKPIWVTRFDRHFNNNVIVYLNETFINKSTGKITISNPIQYPLDQILLMYFLAQREGALIHATGIDINGKGYIFCGKSGAGKTTIARQFTNIGYIELLSDDRIVVRKINNTFKAYGTPWPGEAGIAVNKGVQLSGIFVISHGSYNRVEGITLQKALERLLPVVSIPWYDKETMAKILDFCDNLISNIPAYELHFKPDNEVVNVFEKFVSNQ